MAGTTPFDRNQKARENHQAAQVRHARQEFAQMVGQGHAWVNDRFGNRIQQGQMVLHVATPVGLVCQVVEITPNLNPAAPVGQITVKLQVEIPLTFPAGMNVANLLVLAPPAAGTAFPPSTEIVPEGALTEAGAVPAGGDQADELSPTDELLAEGETRRVSEPVSVPPADEPPIDDTRKE